jgi:choline kinase
MKAIIIAAGMGSRLEHMTEETPKCLLPVNGKSILQHQLEAYRAHDIHDIHVVKGYKQEKIRLPDLTYHLNEQYESNNILISLMHAESAMDDAFMASYSDIVFREEVVGDLKHSDGDISVIVDTGWKSQYDGRTHHPISEAEKTIWNEAGDVKEIGKIIDHPEDAQGEFIGLIKFTKKGAETFTRFYKQAVQEFSGKSFVRAKEFQKAYLTDLIQYMINHGVEVQAVCIDRGWHEIDTIQDITRVRSTMSGDSTP